MRYSVVLLTCFLSCLPAKPSSVSVGMSETMGVFGVINANYDLQLEGWSSDSNHYFLTAGVFPIPFLGGAGFGWRHSFASSRVSPFSSLTGFGTYALPVMCSTGNCKTKLGVIASASLGYDFYLIKSERLNIHLQLGVLTQFDIVNMEFFESPSDKPEIWPVFNLKIGSRGSK